MKAMFLSKYEDGGTEVINFSVDTIPVKSQKPERKRERREERGALCNYLYKYLSSHGYPNLLIKLCSN